ncbi:MAG: hypothetical protein PHH43_08755 [Candidatus Cloacimonetes bacterium]|nr:hypothetical protein [Candidatus Cloacimonadota bacterium]
MLKLALYVSNHGFGHATRISALAEQMNGFGVYCHVISEKPAFLFANLNPNLSKLHNRTVDSGVRHGDNLTVDYDATKKAIINILGKRDKIIAEELEFIRNAGINLILADIPYLVSQIALLADIPAFAISNFDWNFIYKGLFENDVELKPILNTIWSLYQSLSYSFRLPFSAKESVAALPNIEQCGVLARKKTKYADIRKNYDLESDTKLLLVMFGGEGNLELNLESLCKAFKGVVISTFTNVSAANHCQVKISDDFLDLIYSADIVLCKLGYSTLAETVQFNKYILYYSRSNYPEELGLLEGLRDYPNCMHLENLDNSISKWAKLFSQVQHQAVANPQYDNANIDIAGQIIKRYVEQKHPNAKLLSVFDLGSNSLNYVLFDLNTSKVIHQAQCTTKLAKNLRINSFTETRINSVLNTVNPIMQIDKNIVSEKVCIATGVSRYIDNANVLLKRIADRYNVKPRIINKQEESRYVYYAAQARTNGEKGVVIIDVGGASTEIVLSKSTGTYESFYIPFGLLNIKKAEFVKESNIQTVLKKAMQDLPDIKPKMLIGVGLTFTYLAAVIYQGNPNRPDLYQGKRIILCDLQRIAKDIRNHKAEQYIPYLLDFTYLPILKLSIDFAISLLDKYAASEILVNPDGVALGYAKWRLQRQQNKPEARAKKITMYKTEADKR